MELFESRGYDRVDATNFGLWLNLDKVLRDRDSLRIAPLTWATFHFPVNDDHRSYMDESGPNNAGFAVACFTAPTHETRHFHDLLASPYGSLWMRQHTRAQLLYLMLRGELLLQFDAVGVPIAEWVCRTGDGPSERAGLPPASQNVVVFHLAFCKDRTP